MDDLQERYNVQQQFSNQFVLFVLHMNNNSMLYHDLLRNLVDNDQLTTSHPEEE
jgi:hypothetical protein